MSELLPFFHFRGPLFDALPRRGASSFFLADFLICLLVFPVPGQFFLTSETNEFVRQLLNQMQEEMTKEYFKQESTTSPERLKVLESDAKMRLCTVHHLAPENVDVSGHETSPGTYTFTVTERIPVSTFTIPTN